MSPDQLLISAIVILALFVLISLGFWIITRARREAVGDTNDGPEALLRDLREAYEAGSMDTAEFERVKRSLDRGGLTPPSSRGRSALAPGEPADVTQPPPMEPSADDSTQPESR